MNKNRIFTTLLWVRRIVAYSILALLIVAFFFPHTLMTYWIHLAKFQFGQIVSAVFSAGALYALVLFIIYAIITSLFGRFFCSFMCPLGTFMDFVNLLRKKARPQKYSYKKTSFVQIVVPIILLCLFWVGITLPFSYFEPYSILVSKSLFYSGPGFILGGVLLAAYFWGRGFCNFLCPTGFILKLFAKSTKYKLKLTSACISCGKCERACPARCINYNEKTLDYSRCVLCLECASSCPNGSLHYEKDRVVSPGISYVRRSFIEKASFGALAGLSFVTSDTLRAKVIITPDPTPILPPGALSLAHLNAHCTLCHTCIKICPNQALKPSHYGAPTLLDKPILDPYQGFCQYDCVDCTNACPTGALVNLDVEQKHVYRIGRVHFHRDECIVITQGTSCGACAELCPTGAVTMGPGPLGRDEPILRRPLCIGCGACQTACPVRPVSPIWVVGLKYHDMLASPPPIVHSEDIVMEDEFPF
jgi:ferredoxin